jgi:hypothetical protein
METSWLGVLKDGGLLVLVGFILKWVFSEVSNLNQRAAEERIKWQEIISSFQVCQTQIIAESRDFRDVVATAHKAQMEEHREMIKELTEITLTLGRINGYKHE